MPTSLVSTGVQFPDSTIQTTAAGASTMTLVATATSTSGTTLTFTGLTSSYKKYIIYFNNVRNNLDTTGQAISTGLLMEMSTNNGTYYLGGGYFQAFAEASGRSNTPAAATTNASAQNAWNLRAYANSKTTSFCSGEIIVYNPSVNPSFPIISCMTAYAWTPENGYGEQRFGGMLSCIGGNNTSTYSTTGINAVRFSWESGASFTAGNWSVYGTAF